MLTVHDMYFYTTQNSSQLGAGSLREHCIIMFQKSLLPFSASAALTEPAGLSMKGGWGDDCSLCESDWQTAVPIRLPSPAAPLETQTQHKEEFGTETSKSFIPYLCTPVRLQVVIYLSQHWTLWRRGSWSRPSWSILEMRAVVLNGSCSLCEVQKNVGHTENLCVFCRGILYTSTKQFYFCVNNIHYKVFR